jgi:hypothetical protein
MKRQSLASLLLLCTVLRLNAEVSPGKYDIAAIRDHNSLETRVLEEWHAWEKDASVRQKLVEVTVCEWWPGQKVRLPVTLLAPVSDHPCQNLIVSNSGIVQKAAAPSGAMLRLIKEYHVGIALIGMTTIDAMEPVGKLDVGMKEHFLQTKDARYTPAWIWGISDMRALTAAMAERNVFQPTKVLATGGSKRGVGAAAAGIADNRFTAIMPVVAPIIDPPGGPYVEGLAPQHIAEENAQFLKDLAAGAHQSVPPSALEPLVAREKIRAAERITKAEALTAGWNDSEMRAASTLAWEVCRTTNYLPALISRSVEVFYNQGSNDNVSPGLRELGRQFPSILSYIVPGGQHGGAKAMGFLKQVGSLPEVDENLFAFAQHHFFNTRSLPKPPSVTQRWDSTSHKLIVRVMLPEKTETIDNELWWSENRHSDYTFAMEYDTWQSAPLRQVEPFVFEGDVQITAGAANVDFVTVHKHFENGSTLTYSSALQRLNAH